MERGLIVIIKLEVIEKKDGIRNQFVIQADEPVTIEFMETEDNHTVAHVYRGVEVDEYSEPVGMFNSSIDSTGWVVEVMEDESE